MALGSPSHLQREPAAAPGPRRESCCGRTARGWPQLPEVPPSPILPTAGPGKGLGSARCPRWLRDAARGSACRCCSSSLAAGRAPRRGGHLLMLFSLPAAPRARGVASIFPRVQGGQRLFSDGSHRAAPSPDCIKAPGPAVSSSLGRDVPVLFAFIHPSATDPGGLLRVCPPGDPRLEHLRCGCPHQSWGVPAAT